MTTIARRDWTEGSGDNLVVHKNDIYAVNGQLAVASGLEAYAQALEAVVKTVYGELPLDVEAGIPYFSTVFLTPRETTSWAAAVRDAAKSLPFVVSVDSLDYALNPADGRLSYTLTVTTDAGSVSVSQ